VAAVVLGALLVGRWLSRPLPQPVLTESRPTATAKPAPTAKAPAIPRKAETEHSAPKSAGRSADTEAAGAGKLPLYEVFPDKPPSPKTPAAESDTLHAALPPLRPSCPLSRNRPGWPSSSTTWVMTGTWPKN
jgi:hypothetical protein